MEIRISVRNLVEFLLRTGNIDNRHRTVGGENALWEGSRIHRLIQRGMGADYHAEVPLSFVYDTPNYQIVIDGRADGIIENEDGVTIDEIKGTYRDVTKMKEANPIHLAQASCYAYIYALQNNLDEIRIRMTYCNMDTEELKYFFQDYTMQELRAWFDELMESYRRWAEFEVQWKEIRQSSLKEISFPFPYRDGQKELASDVYRTIYHRKKLFIEAPTGVGKTISTVFPAIKAVGEQKAEKIFYLTAKTITRTVASDTFELLRAHGLRYKTVVLTAKEKICANEEVNCNPDECLRAMGHYDRINDAVYDLMIHEDTWSREVVEVYASKHQVCPFELSLDMSLFADAIICDYNYLFDPHVYLKRFFAEGRKEAYVFLIDEAHNLVERGREMYSASLCKEDFLKLRSEMKRAYSESTVYTTAGQEAAAVMKALDKCNKELLALKRACGDSYRMISEPMELETLDILLRRLEARMESYLEEEDGKPVRDQVLDFYFVLSHYLLIGEMVDDAYSVYTTLEQNGNFSVHLFCVNPARNLKKCTDHGISSIFFSATLLPIQYYKRLLGGEDADYEVYAHSVFSSQQMGLFISSELTTKFTKRSKELYVKIALQIAEVVECHCGNYLVFFPSHHFAQMVYQKFTECIGNRVETVLQSEYMSEEAREIFLQRFYGNQEFDFSSIFPMEVEVETEKSLVAFSVMGGIFSEGIDLKGKALIGAIVVGNGLPQVCLEREILKNYFDEDGGNGFDYAYRFPGMNKVLQSAGRVIRTVEDRGIVVLLEKRFLEPEYLRMFPREWDHYRVVTGDCIGEQVRAFWSGSDC